MRCTTFDLPVVEPLAKETIDTAGLGDRVITASGDFFLDPIPEADVITMGMILHQITASTGKGNSSNPPTKRSPPAARSSASKHSSTTPAAPTPSHSLCP